VYRKKIGGAVIWRVRTRTETWPGDSPPGTRTVKRPAEEARIVAGIRLKETELSDGLGEKFIPSILVIVPFVPVEGLILKTIIGSVEVVEVLEVVDVDVLVEEDVEVLVVEVLELEVEVVEVVEVLLLEEVELELVLVLDEDEEEELELLEVVVLLLEEVELELVLVLDEDEEEEELELLVLVMMVVIV
jgi:hypothetical protein